MNSINVDNQRYLELAEMILLLGNAKNNSIFEKHKFTTLLFFLKNPSYLEKLVQMRDPAVIDKISIESYERYNLLYEEGRVSLISSHSSHLLSYLLSRELITTEFTKNGFLFQLKNPKGFDLYKELRKLKQFKKLNIRAKVINTIFGKMTFDEIKDVLLNDFKELKI